MNVVREAVLVEQLVELLVIDTMRPLDLVVEVRHAWADVDVPDVERLQVPMKLGLELSAVVGLDHMDAKRQPAGPFVANADRGSLGARVKDLQDADARAVVDRRELIQPLSGPRNSREERHVRLEAVPRLRLLISLPALVVRPVLLIRRQSLHAVLAQDPMDGRTRHRHLMKSLQVVGDFAGTEMVLLA